MNRALVLTLPLALTALSCAHDRESAGTTTITSGTPGGPRVTNIPVAEDDRAARLARELCRRDAACGRIETSGTDEARLLGEQNCVTTKAPEARRAIGAWACEPAPAEAPFEECLAAIRSERCETRVDRADALPACRREAVCRR